MQLLAPLQDRMPSTEAEFTEMVHYIRRMGHVLEHAPGNVGNVLQRGGNARMFAQAYMAQPDGTFNPTVADAPTFAQLAEPHGRTRNALE